MPTYQYRCTECGGDIETVQSFSDAALTECPSCSGRLRKVFGSIGLVFKGTGFYKTDSRSSAAGGPAGRDKDKDTKTSEKATSSASKSAETAKESAGSPAPATAASGSSGKASASTSAAA